MSEGHARMNVIDLQRMAYAEAFERQRAVHADVVAGSAPPTLILVEHDPVITISRRKAAPQHLLVDEKTLAERGIDIQPTDRGGDITYHGPGQLVAYPIIRLNDLRLNVGRYMRLLEQIVIDTLEVFDIKALRDDAGTGVWVEVDAVAKAKAESGKRRAATANATNPASRDVSSPVTSNHLPSVTRDESRKITLAKIAAVGVRISRGVSLHGLALNVTTNLSHFDNIIPCGLAGKPVTSLAELLDDAMPPMPPMPSMEDVKKALIAAATEHLGDSGQ